jgi:hypothetical protein
MKKTDSTKCLLASFHIIINFNLRPLEAEAGPNGVHDDFLNIFSCLQNHSSRKTIPPSKLWAIFFGMLAPGSLCWGEQ